jgi:hypothetical protein
MKGLRPKDTEISCQFIISPIFVPKGHKFILNAFWVPEEKQGLRCLLTV